MSSRAAFQSRLEEAHRIHIDPIVIAYHLLGISPYVDLTTLLFAGIHAETIRAQTSALSVYQLLVEPYRKGEEELALRAFKYLGSQPGLEIVPVTARIARQAAEVKARLGGSPERAVQLATALLGGSRAYLAIKSSLRRIAGMEIINLEDFATG